MTPRIDSMKKQLAKIEEKLEQLRKEHGDLGTQIVLAENHAMKAFINAEYRRRMKEVDKLRGRRHRIAGEIGNLGQDAANLEADITAAVKAEDRRNIMQQAKSATLRNGNQVARFYQINNERTLIRTNWTDERETTYEVARKYWNELKGQGFELAA